MLYYTVLSSDAVGRRATRIALVGPTAAGKTAVGIALAREIINADSVQVYRRMDIGAAKPNADERAQAVFHAIDVAEPDNEWTLADFQRLGEDACASIATRGYTPLIVGGTGLYVRALTTRLEIPATPPDEDFRARWQAIAAERGNMYVQSALARIDPESAARIHVNDLRRQIRALEVHATLGVTLSQLHADNRAKTRDDQAVLFGLDYADRRTLYARIEARVDQMLAAGFLDEVRGLRAAGYGRALKSMQSLGYRHLAAYLDGERDWETTVATLKADTRHFARRQLIWFRADPRIQWLEAEDRTPEQLAEEITARLNRERPLPRTSD